MRYYFVAGVYKRYVNSSSVRIIEKSMLWAKSQLENV